jgi:hypothetical protein
VAEGVSAQRGRNIIIFQ